MAKKLHLLSSLTCFSSQRTARNRISSPLNVCKLLTTSGFVTDVNNQVQTRQHNEKKQLHKQLQLHVRANSSLVGSGIRPAVGVFSYDEAVRSQVRLGNMDKALELMENATWTTDSLTYKIVICGLCKDRKIEEAANLFQKMLAMKVAPRCGVHDVLINEYCRIGKVEEAKGILNQIRNLGMFPDEGTFRFLLRGLCAAKRTEEANQLLKEMEGAGIIPNLITYIFMFDGHMLCGNLDAVVELFKEVSTKEAKLSAFICHAFLENLFLMGKASEIMIVLECLRLNGVVSTIDVYCSLVDVYHQVGKESKGLSLMEQIEASDFQPDSITYNRVVRRLSEVHTVGMVEKLVRLMSDRGLAPNLQTYNILIDGYGQHGQFDRCFQILQEVEHKGLEPNETSYGALINCLCKKGKLTNALILLHKMTKAGISPSPETYNSVINGFCKLGQVSKAEELAQKLPSQANEEAAARLEIQLRERETNAWKSMLLIKT